MKLELPLHLHRLSRRLHLLGFGRLSLVAKQLNFHLHGCDLSPRASIGKIALPHPAGVVVGASAIIEDNVIIMSGVVLGVRGAGDIETTPIIRDSTLIGSGAKVLGRIEIGRCSSIGANAVVLESVPPHSTVTGIPARIRASSNSGLAKPQ